MAGVRRALIVATDEYSDSKLTNLSAPATDARDLADVLRDEAVGCFEVQTVLNRPSHEIELAIADFFGAGRFGDTLLAHFSCHGVKSPSGELYFATTNTDLADTFKLKVTGVPSALVRDAMEESRASLIICLVDCCYSGAFVKLAKAADTVDLTERLGGKGRAVITASTSLQLALDGKEEPSLFTHAVIDGLRTGEADRDLDGLISLDELYSFVHEQVTSRNPNQTPVKSFDVQGEVYVARRSAPVDTPAPLDPDLLTDARAPVVYKRLGAVKGLANVLEERHPGRSLAARLELARMASGDDSLSVRREAQNVMDAAGELPTPTIPDFEPTVTTRGGPTVPDTVVTGGTADTEATDQEPTEKPVRLTASDTDDGGGTRGWWQFFGRRSIVVTAVALAGVLAVVGWLAWRALHDEGTDDAGNPILSDTEVLVTADDPELGTGIVAVDVETGDSRLVIAGRRAVLPTISEDREWMAYLTDAPFGVPRMARVDGSDDFRLLDREARRTCPFTTRPTFSPDGGFLAAVCVDESGATVALVIVDRDGHPVRVLSEDDDIRGGPTWTGDGRIVFMRDLLGNEVTTLWAISTDGGKPERVTDGLDGSDSHPDWSEQGLLFLRDREGSSDVFSMETLDTRGVTPLTSSGTAGSPTWAPGGEPAMLWVEPAADGDGKTLWVKALSDTSPTEVTTGSFGPPAWGSR